jgi:hypothetical protein
MLIYETENQELIKTKSWFVTQVRFEASKERESMEASAVLQAHIIPPRLRAFIWHRIIKA